MVMVHRSKYTKKKKKNSLLEPTRVVKFFTWNTFRRTVSDFLQLCASQQMSVVQQGSSGQSQMEAKI